jgi:predicted alpha/beta-fold hydrolase
MGGHLQTILAAKCSAAPYPAWQRERWEWADGDFCDADYAQQTDPQAPLLVLFHGLEGSSQSHYARSIGAYFQAQGWRVCVPHFRGCSGEPNRLLRAYHSGDAAEIAQMLRRVHNDYPLAPLYAAGVSLGGNALLCYLSQQQHGLPLQAAASVCAPLDLARCGDAITTGFANVYTLMFMRTLRAKALEKRARFPDGCDWDAVMHSKNLAQFDDAFTAPVHGFTGMTDYYTRASAKPKLKDIALPTLLLNAQNDPFVPRDVIANLTVSSAVRVEQTAHGGHVGFATGSGLGELTWLAQRLLRWFTIESVEAHRG